MLAPECKSCFHSKTVTSVKPVTFYIHSCQVQKLKQVLQMLIWLVQSVGIVSWYFTKERARENEREKEKGGTVAEFDEINGLKVPCSAVMASIRHAWQGKTGTFQTDGLKVFTALWLRVTAYLNATCWGGNCAMKETHSIYLPALIASKRLVCWGVNVHLGKRQLLKGHSWGYREEIKAFC